MFQPSCESSGSLVASGGSGVRVKRFRATASPTALTELGECYHHHILDLYEGGESISAIHLMI